MGLTKPNQKLRRDLKAAAFSLEEAALEMFRLAKQRGDVELLEAMDTIEKLHEQADRLKAYADEVKDQRITRAKANS
ncbi:hypothetical protein [Pseudomonas chlororaphis]|jgi:hypothetical protein|uniref:hypothetical protein n=1 Tax=Pseudomonas chlororaphis TaxID=587753 RepID=UPI000865275E|nr:hypothetical protein [Pseudomonas chlororaphis]QLL15457.1 hypothetical protein H0I86_10350 [Pseudomonas chlororaphis subsp. aurantiaca]BAV74156.1 hypothetical protein PCAU_1947 [Pseudomonas chlororaphis subsp. aurantiaca]